MKEDHLQRFRDAVSPERQRISLAEAALMVAQDAYPDLDIQARMGDIERLGATLAIPVNRNNSIKLYASQGVFSRTGNGYDLFGIAWQYRWGAGL